MFDWSDQNQVGNTIWADFNDNEDHIVPYPEAREDHSLLNFGYKHTNIDGSYIDFRDHASCSKENCQDSSGEKQLGLNETGILSAPQLGIDCWSEPPTLNETAIFCNNGSKISEVYLENLAANPCLSKDGVLRKGESALFDDCNEDTHNSYSYCDWGNMGDLNDLDSFFSNESIFGNEMDTSVDFPPLAPDITQKDMQSMPLHHLQLKKEPASQPCYSVQTDDTIDSQKVVKSTKRRDERGRSKSSNKLVSNQGPDESLASQAWVDLSPTAAQPSSSHHFQVQGVVDMEQYDYKNPIILGKQTDEAQGPLAMTAQEKIEKLRRRQQMQAMLAIQQQQQQFGHQACSSEKIRFPASSFKGKNQDSFSNSIAVEEHVMKCLPSEVKIPQKSSSIFRDDPYMDENVYHQLQEALKQLDERVRLRIRDSLFRLARGALERQSGFVGCSTNQNTRDEDTKPGRAKRKSRSAGLVAAETDTNPLDRTVAHLLFHQPCENLCFPQSKYAPACSSNQLFMPVLEGQTSTNWSAAGGKQISGVLVSQPQSPL